MVLDGGMNILSAEHYKERIRNLTEPTYAYQVEFVA